MSMKLYVVTNSTVQPSLLYHIALPSLPSGVEHCCSPGDLTFPVLYSSFWLSTVISQFAVCNGVTLGSRNQFHGSTLSTVLYSPAVSSERC